MKLLAWDQVDGVTCAECQGDATLCEHMFKEPRHKRGRPHKPAAERTSARGVRLTDAEYKAACEAAARAGLQFSEFVRRAVLAACEEME